MEWYQIKRVIKNVNKYFLSFAFYKIISYFSGKHGIRVIISKFILKEHV